jgi:hypothetical protein
MKKDETAHRGTEGDWCDGAGRPCHVQSTAPLTNASNRFSDSGDVVAQIADAFTCDNPPLRLPLAARQVLAGTLPSPPRQKPPASLSR